MEQVELLLGRKGPYLVGLEGYKKLVVPDRRSNIVGPDGRILDRHEMVVVRITKDTQPDNPRKGVLFVLVEHDPNKCSFCRYERELQEFRERDARVKAQLEPLGLDFILRDPLYFVDEAQSVIAKARRGDPSDVIKHPEWWLLVREANELACSMPKAGASRETAQKYKELKQRVEHLKSRSLYPTHYKDLGYRTRYRWTMKPDGSIESAFERQEWVTRYEPESDDGFRGGHYFGGYEWRKVREEQVPPPPTEWLEEATATLQQWREDLLSAEEQLSTVDEAFRREVAEAEARRKPQIERLDELRRRIQETCPYHSM